MRRGTVGTAVTMVFTSLLACRASAQTLTIWPGRSSRIRALAPKGADGGLIAKRGRAAMGPPQ
jgi:hypothetical protein